MTSATEPYVLNIGPQHPSTHGVFRLRVVMDGERVAVREALGHLQMAEKQGTGRTGGSRLRWQQACCQNPATHRQPPGKATVLADNGTHVLHVWCLMALGGADQGAAGASSAPSAPVFHR